MIGQNYRNPKKGKMISISFSIFFKEIVVLLKDGKNS